MQILIWTGCERQCDGKICRIDLQRINRGIQVAADCASLSPTATLPRPRLNAEAISHPAFQPVVRMSHPDAREDYRAGRLPQVHRGTIAQMDRRQQNSSWVTVYSVGFAVDSSRYVSFRHRWKPGRRQKRQRLERTAGRLSWGLGL